METTYIITFIVDGRDWASRPIKGSLQEAIDEAKDQLRISRFYGKKPKNSLRSKTFKKIQKWRNSLYRSSKIRNVSKAY